jgi:hypothetical protein
MATDGSTQNPAIGRRLIQRGDRENAGWGGLPFFLDVLSCRREGTLGNYFASLPVLRRPHDHHRDLRARLLAALPSANPQGAIRIDTS